jgi:hypothetical protein
MIRIIGVIACVAAFLGLVTIFVPNKHFRVLTWILFGLVVLGTALLTILLFGGTIYL